MADTKRKRRERGSRSGNAGLPVIFRSWMMCLLLAVITGAIYWPVIGFGFLNYDDPAYFSINRHVLAGLNWPNFLWAFQTTTLASWYPLTWLSYLLDATMFGAGAAGPHFTNLLLHVINTLLVFQLLKQLTGKRWRSAVVAALFAVHPLHVEAVAWIAERKGLLSTLFGLLTLSFYARYSKAKNHGQKTRAVVYYLAALLLFTGSLLSKPALVALPLGMVLLDYWPLGRFQQQGQKLKTLFYLLWEKLPFILVGVASTMVTIFVHKQSGALTALTTTSLSYRIESAFVSYARYVEKTIWPTKLALPYPDPGSWPWWAGIGAAVLVLGLSYGAIWLGRRRPYLAVGWLWFLVMLGPVIGIIGWGSHTMADRFTYVPLLGLFVIFTWLGTELSRGNPLLRSCVIVGVVGILTACVIRTEDQLSYWKNSETLFRHSLAVTENNIVALDHLGIRLSFEGRDAEAIEYLNQALRLNPEGPMVLYDLGHALAIAGRFPEAETNFQAALQIMPEFVEAHNNLGLVLMRLGRPEEAITQYQAALKYAPDDAAAHKNLADAFAARGRLAEAVEQYKLALSEEPGDAEAHYSLGLAFAVQEKWDDAIPQYAATARLSPTNAAVRYNLGYALRVRGRLDEAEEQLRMALRLAPEFPLAEFNLGEVLAQNGKANEAIFHLQEALRLKPDYEEAKKELEALRATQTTSPLPSPP